MFVEFEVHLDLCEFLLYKLDFLFPICIGDRHSSLSLAGPTVACVVDLFTLEIFIRVDDSLS